MTKQYDIVVMGAGHNTLGAAAYLAKAGKKVLVLEKKSFIGGGAITLERTLPGFLHDQHSAAHIIIQANPLLLNDELGLLSRFGLKYNYSEMAGSTILYDFRCLKVYHDLDLTCQEIARHSEKDAEAYREFTQWSVKMLPMVMAGMFNVPIPMGAFIGMLESNEDGRRMLDLMLRSPLQIVDHLFESDIVKIHLLKLASEGILQFPDDMGTGFGLMLLPALMHRHRTGRPVGGSGELSKALGRCLEYHGGEIRTGVEVESVIVRGGKAVGLRSTDKEEFMARDAVVASIHPQRLDRFVDGLDDKLVRRARNTLPAPYSLFKIDAALDGPIESRVPADALGIREVIFANTLTEFLESFDPLRHGRVQTDRPLVGGAPSALPGRVPDGRSMLYLVSYQPYSLDRQGPARWDEIKERTADAILEKFTHFYPGLTPDRVMARAVDSPLDCERWSPNSFVNGEPHGLGMQFFHTGGLRPIPELARFAVPGIDSLYLCGPFMHPGGGIFGAGRPTAIKICDDLGIDFDRVLAN